MVWGYLKNEHQSRCHTPNLRLLFSRAITLVKNEAISTPELNQINKNTSGIRAPYRVLHPMSPPKYEPSLLIIIKLDNLEATPSTYGNLAHINDKRATDIFNQIITQSAF